VPVITGPQDPAAAGGGRRRAGHADREQVIETLKDASVHGRLTRDELDARAARALTAWTRAELAALTADIPPAPVAAGPEPARPPALARRRPLARATAGSGGCLVIAAAAVRVAAIADPTSGATPAPIPEFFAPLCVLVAIAAVVAALCILGYGVGASIQQLRSRRQPPPRPGPGGHVLDDGQHGGTGHGPVPSGPGDDRALRAELRADESRQRRRHVPARAGRAPGGVRPAPALLTA
jgi:hypothetical protein